MAILSSIFLLRDRLAQISFLFRENAADLYPQKIFRLPRESLVSRSRMPRRRLEKSRRSTRRRLPFDKLDVEDFPEQLDLFSRALFKFLYNLNEFPEFTDKSVDAPIMAFEDDLKVYIPLPTVGFKISLTFNSFQYWASCLIVYGGIYLHLTHARCSSRYRRTQIPLNSTLHHGVNVRYGRTLRISQRSIIHVQRSR